MPPKQRDFQLKPRHINIGAVSKEGKPLFHQLGLGNPLPYYEEIKRLETKINSAFLLDLFQVLADRASRSAAESIEKTREKGAFVAPVIGRLQSEFIGTMIKRELDILNSQNRLPLFSESDKQPDFDTLKVEYTSPLFRYQQAEVVASIYEQVSRLYELAARVGDPSLLDVINFDEVSRFSMSRGGVPAVCINSQKEVEDIREERKEQMLKQQEAQLKAQERHLH